MKLIPSAVMSIALLAGLAGSAVAYQVASAEPGGRAPQREAVAAQSTASTGAAATKRDWAPCRRPAHLEKGVCVTDVVRTVVLPAAPAAAAAPAPAAQASTPAAPRTGSKDDDDDAYDDKGDDHADDDGDDEGDDHADEHGDDDGGDHADEDGDHGDEHGDDGGDDDHGDTDD